MAVTTVTNVTDVTASTTASRGHRGGSKRLAAAALLTLLAVVVVAAAIPTGSWLMAALAGSACALLGVVATRLTRTEVLIARRDAARDRADQAKAYRDLANLRSAETGATIKRLSTEIRDREADIAALQDALVESHQSLAASARVREGAESEAAVLAERVLELEITVESLRAELDAVTALGLRRTA
ncbi:hypothetical protein Back2_20760 [Nocardioides baekrokdamisoli]|uniref:Uncharacterized protein n=1 Tax=Nocardioides baekrokdamisoli TaxID=1804624 RepID=A0A3G9J442_9ACTN|nr:hypothetical protein [Nocardioides baekrokdamisoli]BBH17789.1 hypothetical protein Back2_20760 [Nocardioides baekrokdamisoli]